MKKSIVVEYLEKYIELVKTLNYKNISIEEFIFINGKEFSQRGKVNEEDYGEMKMCYKNAFFLMIESGDLFYCEGFASFSGLPLPVLHAWCVDKEGRVYDPTWKDGGDEYYGVAFNRKFAYSRILKNGPGIIDDWKHHWPLLSGKEKRKWQAEKK